MTNCVLLADTPSQVTPWQPPATANQGPRRQLPWWKPHPLRVEWHYRRVRGSGPLLGRWRAQCDDEGHVRDLSVWSRLLNTLKDIPRGNDHNKIALRAKSVMQHIPRVRNESYVKDLARAAAKGQARGQAVASRVTQRWRAVEYGSHVLRHGGCCLGHPERARESSFC